MFEKLLSVLLHAKGGALATVLVIGASGALVTATVENGLTTVTVTQPSTTTGTDTTTTTTNPVILALFNRTNADEDPTSTATGNGCSDAAKGTNEQVQRVNDAWQTDHQVVVGLNKDAKSEDARKLVKTADRDLKDIRQAAVKALHELFKSDECKGNDDEDKDNEDDSSTTGTTTGVSVAFSGEDAKAIADLAITAMDAKVAKLQADLAALTPTTTSDNKGKSDSNKSDKSKSSDNKGKGHTEGLSHDNEDDD